MVETIALAPALGVEVVGVDDLLDDALIAQCLEMVKSHGVLLFRGLKLNDDAHVAFSRKLGTVLAPDGREILQISLDPSKNPAADYLRGTFNWHIDDTPEHVPAKAAVLTARQVATVGGATGFANTYAAYENLAERERRRYEDLRVVHTIEAAQRLVVPDPTEDELAGWGTIPSYESPLVWPRRDGRRSLVLGPTADHITGMGLAEGRALLAELLAWVTQERFCYTHQWQVGDLIVWDNTGILHRALPYDPSSRRTLHRTLIAGDEGWS